MRHLLRSAIPFAIILSGCGGSDNTMPRQLAEVPVAGTFAYDLGVVDQASSRYYQSDSGNNQIDVFDTKSDTVLASLAVHGFAGNQSVGFDHSHNGPNGIVIIPGGNQIYAGDVNSVKVIDATTGIVIKSIPVSNSGLRVDEGCYDADDSIVMFSSPEEVPPIATFISTKTQTIITKLAFSADTSGLEQCVYNPSGKNFLINNDGTSANTTGEVDVISVASVVANAPVVSHTFPLPGCGPGGLVLGFSNEILVGCNPQPPLTRQVTLVLDRTSGTVVATIPFGGADAVGYDSVTNRYFIPAFFHQSTNVPGSPLTAVPTLGIFDAAQKTSIARLPTGIGSHAIAIDGTQHKVFIPHVAGPPGSPFAIAGVTVFTTD